MLPPRQNISFIYVERPRIYLHLCPSPVVLAAVRDQGYCPGCPEPTTILLPWASNKAITELVSALTSLVLTSNMQGTTITGSIAIKRKKRKSLFFFWKVIPKFYFLFDIC